MTCTLLDLSSLNLRCAKPHHDMYTLGPKQPQLASGLALTTVRLATHAVYIQKFPTTLRSLALDYIAGVCSTSSSTSPSLSIPSSADLMLWTDSWQDAILDARRRISSRSHPISLDNRMLSSSRTA